MKSTGRKLAMVVVLLLLAGTSFAGGKSQAAQFGKSGVIALDMEHRVGEVLLPKGNYQVRADHQNHELVFRKAGGGPEVARVHCRMGDLANKAPATAVYKQADASGHMKITEIQIGGEKVRHLLD